MGFVVFVNGIVILFTACLMGVDALLFHDTAEQFGEGFLLTGLVGVSLCLAASRRATGLEQRHTFLLTSSVWMTAALTGALPMYLWGMTPADAVFEAMSGITTTGSTVMSGLEQTPRGILLWRAILQALGGVGFVVTGMALLPILQVGGMQLYQTESSERGEKQLRNAAAFAMATLVVYLGLMLLCGALYALGGMSPFDAVTHAMTTMSSGGYSNYDSSFGHFDSGYLQWVATVFMLGAGLPFAWYIRAVMRGIWRSEQVLMMLRSLGVVIGLLTLWLVLADHRPFAEALRLVAFNVVSVVTTTGYATTDYLTWGPVAVAAFFLLTAVGGCTGSTAGGAKAMRWVILARVIKTWIRRIRHPHGIFVVRYEGRAVSEEVLSGVMAFFVIYVVTVSVLAVALDFDGLDFSTALSGALTAVANVGPGVGGIIGPAGNFATLSDESKVMLAFGMFAGRLEMFTVFVLFLPRFWRAF
ncbi:TrkH family potassium uptake protein [Actibacterium ureilyticum]|uniref:TrkH family potassium uptake protein n=1 Tax=Actibacterium ureilyticum TaxID=1590614 RepID=UPI000BAADC82|nr:TrkH family potassium uptake protein [Actibacterium ureilyticum]